MARRTRREQVESSARKYLRGNYELRGENPEEYIRLLFSTYTIEGAQRVLAQRARTREAYLRFPPDEAAVARERAKLADLHDRYRRKRGGRGARSFGSIDFDTHGGYVPPDDDYAIFLFYH